MSLTLEQHFLCVDDQSIRNDQQEKDERPILLGIKHD